MSELAVMPSPSPAVLRYAGLAANDPLAPLVVLLCERYALDPLLEHVEVIQASGKRRLYITRDGYVHIAHRSGQLDGIAAVADEGERGWRATATVWRKDHAHAYAYSAGCGTAENKPDPEAMAIARAERRALKRAFPVLQAIEYEHGLAGEDDTDAPPASRPLEAKALDATPHRAEPRGPHWRPTTAEQRDAHKAVAALEPLPRAAFLARHGITDYGAGWPDNAVAEVLGFGPPAPAPGDARDTATPDPAPDQTEGGA